MSQGYREGVSHKNKAAEKKNHPPTGTNSHLGAAPGKTPLRFGSCPASSRLFFSTMSFFHCGSFDIMSSSFRFSSCASHDALFLLASSIRAASSLASCRAFASTSRARSPANRFASASSRIRCASSSFCNLSASRFRSSASRAR